MSPQRFHDLLHDVATHQEPIRIDPGTFDRGRRALRQSLAAGAALAVLAIIGGVLAVSALRPTPPPPPTSGQSALALPDRVYDVPERLADVGPSYARWKGSLASPTLAVGPAAVAFTPFTLAPGPVLVSAETGAYHLLDLPGYDVDSTFLAGTTVIALSPDGRRLAYPWHEPLPADSQDYATSGVRILDLENGEITDLLEKRGFGVHASSPRWSPDGRYLTYELRVRNVSQTASRGPRSSVARLWDGQTQTRTTLPASVGSERGGFALSPDGGTVALTNPTGLEEIASGRSLEVPPGDTYGGAAWSPTGDQVAFAAGGEVVVTSATGKLARRIDLGVGRLAGSDQTILGWSGDLIGTAVNIPSNNGDGTQAILVTDADSGEVTRLATLEPGVAPRQLTVASDLLDRPTRQAIESDWPTDWAALAPYAIGGGLGLFVLLMLLTTRQRHRWVARLGSRT